MKHLGGHNNITNIDFPILEKIKNDFNIVSCLDIGCGPGDMEKLCSLLKISWIGIDGDLSVKKENILIHDFTRGSLNLKTNYDLGWSVEFLEHVEEKYIPNFISCFCCCRFLLITAALPGSPGKHHVNCQANDYWIELFSKYGFQYDNNYTEELKEISNMRKNFFKKSGMFFKKYE